MKKIQIKILRIVKLILQFTERFLFHKTIIFTLNMRILWSSSYFIKLILKFAYTDM